MAGHDDEKAAFFKHLDCLDDDSTASEDESVVTYRPSKIRRIENSHPALTSTVTTATNPEPIPISRPELFRKAPSLLRASTDTQGTNSKGRKLLQENQHLRRTSSEPKHVVSVSAPLSTKGALFEGCSFYFVPNSTISKVRRLRIQSAVSQGARWVQQLDSSITHIIVDAELNADTVLKSLKGKIDLTCVPVIKDKWLIESITHKVLKDVRQDRFLLEGITEFAKKLVNSCNHAISGEIASAQFEETVQEPVRQPSALDDTTSDELTAILKELKTTEHLPLDAELDLDRFISSSSGDEEDTESTSKTARKKPSSTENKGFSCMEPHTGQSDNNPNNRTIDVLQMMATYYDRTGDHWRTTAYRKAISALRKQDKLVCTKKQALQIFGIGSRLADKIEEIATTDRLQKLEFTLTDPDDIVLQLFMGIYGAGLKQARLWIDQGYRTLDDLKANVSLTDNQRIGIEHYQDFQQRIPRAEVTQHGAIVQKALHRANKHLKAIIGGSYRRGMLDSGDIDVMITHDNAELPQLRKWVFEESVPYLFRIGFVKHAFATSRPTRKQTQKTPTRGRRSVPGKENPEADAFADSKDTGTKFHGASVLAATAGGQSVLWRRIDLLLVPASALGASLLYFTGNDIFNRSMRLLASRKGMRLNQYGLYKNVLRGKGRVKETEGELLEGRSEKRIFELLSVPWREPEERRC